jgi:exodeoxyribonuclease III
MGAWLEERRPDVVCLQEVRGDDAALAAALGPGWAGVHEESATRGRAGVAVMARATPVAVRTGLAGDGFDGSGRWVEADLPVSAGATAEAGPAGAVLLTVVSAYVPTGEAGTARQEEKYRFLDAMATRLAGLAADGRHVLLTGDLNVAHREADLKNWKGNLTKAGFLPDERAWFDRLLGEGPPGEGPSGEGRGRWVDVHRCLAGEGPGPYSWWSWRGKAFDNDAGWRIDYQLATPGLAALAVKAEVDRAPSYAQRWSDHAPLTIDYDLALARGQVS